MDATTNTKTTNQRLTTILFVLLIIFVLLLIIGIVAGFLMMSWGMMGMGGMMTNDMSKACLEMMRNVQAPG